MSEIVLTHQANPGAMGSGVSALYFNATGQLCRVGNDGVEVVISTDALSWKASVRAVTPAATLFPAANYSNGSSGVGATLTGSSNGTLATQDGLTIVVGNRLLVKNETNGAWNGIYRMTQLGDGSTPYILTREPDADTAAELLGAAVLVTEGSANADTVWVCTTNAPITVGTTALAWSQLDLGSAVVGPGTSTDKAIARWSGTSGGVAQDSSVVLDDDGAIHNYRAKRNAQTGTTYTLQVSDSGKVIELTNAGAITVTLPNSLPEGWSCTLVQGGAGQVTLSAGSGALLRNRQTHTKLAGQWAYGALHVRGNSGGSAAEYVFGGDTAA